MTDGEVASAQSSGLVKPAPPLPPESPPPQPRAHCGLWRAFGRAGRARRARARA